MRSPVDTIGVAELAGADVAVALVPSAAANFARTSLNFIVFIIRIIISLLYLLLL
jgi:hypothetical protein